MGTHVTPFDKGGAELCEAGDFIIPQMMKISPPREMRVDPLLQRG